MRYHLSLAVAVAAAAWAWQGALNGPTECEAFHQYRTAGDLFYNYYVPPGDAGDVGAQMYLSPRPTPPLVGHTYVTYQPLMPHEFLYPHKRHYVRYHPCRGYTKTTVHWKRDWVNLGKTPRPYTSIPLKKWFHEEF